MKNSLADGLEALSLTPRGLLDLGADVLLLVLTHLHEQALLRGRMCCHALHAAAADPSLWRAAAEAFFAGELPPPDLLPALDDPMLLLREQVEWARRLLRSERERKCFLIPEPRFEGTRAWVEEQDRRVAEEQCRRGDRHARPGMPYYGCSGGAYVTTVLCFGRFVKGVLRNSVAASYFGEAEGTRVAWSLRPAPEERPVGDGALMDGCDYGPLARWRDLKVAELAEASGRPRLAERVRLECAALEEQGLYKTSCGEDTSEDTKQARPPPPLRLPQLLAAQYGGAFIGEECGTSIGTIYEVACRADGTKLYDFSAM